jgi:putative glutamine amidotransferase
VRRGDERAKVSRVRPLIGLTCDYETITDRRGQPSPRFVVPEAYVAAVSAAGGEPLALPHRSIETAARLLELVQGLVVTGGDFDVPPSFYGDTPHPKLGRLCEPRSAFERALLAGALERRMPVLGVCGGMQLLNVVRGGTLFQDVSERAGTQEHTQPFDKRKAFHEVAVEPGSLLFRAVGRAQVGVNSTHHQIVRELGRGVRPSATAPDGVVEAIEVPELPFVLGVQWHPEAMPDEPQLGIYRTLVEAAGAFR